MLPSIEELAGMMKIDIMEADRSQLVDIQGIEIDDKKSVKSRALKYIEEVRNPYLFNVGEYVVKVSYQQSGDELNERMLKYVSQMTKIKC